MFIKTIKEYDKGKCTTFNIREKGFLFSQDYEVKIFTTIPKKKVPKEEALKEISKLITKADKRQSSTNKRYPLKVELEGYKEYQIVLKKIDPIKDGE